MLTAELHTLAEDLLNLLVVLSVPVYLGLCHQNRDIAMGRGRRRGGEERRRGRGGGGKEGRRRGEREEEERCEWVEDLIAVDPPLQSLVILLHCSLHCLVILTSPILLYLFRESSQLVSLLRCHGVQLTESIFRRRLTSNESINEVIEIRGQLFVGELNILSHYISC